jgi:RNA polymerase sigma-70 factor (ECF subfamily)
MTDKTNVNEERWLQRARQGDDDAFARLVESYQGPVFNLCFRMLGDPYEAEDAAQEAFLKAYKNMNRYDPNRKFVNWMLTIASNHCVDRLRRKRLKLISLDEGVLREYIQAPTVDPEMKIVEMERQGAIQDMLDQLKPKDKAAVLLRYWYDMSYDEIAATLSLTEGAVKSRLHRARRDLALYWTDHLEPQIMSNRRQDEPSTIS